MNKATFFVWKWAGLTWMIINAFGVSQPLQAATLVGSASIAPPTFKLTSNELMEIQEVGSRLIDEVSYFEKTYGGTDDTILNYELEFQAQVAEWEPTPTHRLEITESVLHSDILLLGDYHQLYENTENFITLLEQNKKFKKPIILIESLSSHKQKQIDAWLAGNIPAKKLRKALEFDRHWPFNWKNTQRVLSYARKNGFKVLAMEDRRNPGDLRLRDQRMEEFIRDTQKEHPEFLVAVQVGNLHLLGQDHLYDRLASNLNVTCVINELDRQFNEALYATGDLNKAGHWQLTEDVFFSSTVTPMETKLQEFLYWSEVIGLEGDANAFLKDLGVGRILKKLTRARNMIKKEYL